MRTTRVRRFSSWLSRSRPLVVRPAAGGSRGRPGRQAVLQVLLQVRMRPRVAVARQRSATRRGDPRAWALLGAAKMARRSAASARRLAMPTGPSRLRAKWTWQRC